MKVLHKLENDYELDSEYKNNYFDFDHYIKNHFDNDYENLLLEYEKLRILLQLINTCFNEIR